MQWSKMKKTLEDFLCPSLKGRVSYGVTNYRKAHDEMGRAYIRVDSKEIINMCTIKKEMAIFKEQRTIKNSQDFVEKQEKEDIVFEILRKEGFSEECLDSIIQNRETHDIAKENIESKGIFAQYDFWRAAEAFLNLSIEDALKSTNTLIKIFALMDRRVGKRTLNSIKEFIQSENQWVQTFYQIRIEADQEHGFK